jgi:feruloyl esterase
VTPHRPGKVLAAGAIGLFGTVLSAPTASAAECSALAGFQSPDTKILKTAAIDAPTRHCKIDGVIGEAVNFSLWLPEVWKGKFVMGGQGGFAGVVESQALAMGALEKGYAVAGTDTGHAGAGIDSTWAHGDMEKIANYGHAAVHRVTVAAKFLIERHYAAPISRSYFAGCSNGGRQGLMSAQRYPEDFDGVIAGAPAIDFTAISASFINATRVNYPEPDNLGSMLISWNESKALGDAVLAACDGNDGIEDGVIADPTACAFDIGTLACKSKDTDQCLSKKERAALKSIYAGPRTKDRTVGYGYPFGGENLGYGWGAWLIGGKDIIAKGVPSLAYAYGVGFMRDFVFQDRHWNYPGMDFEGLEARARLVQATLSPTNPDLSAFRKRGGKLLMYHGWADSGLSPYMSIDYAARVYKRDAHARDDARLFLLPGVLHCSSGPGPDQIDHLDALDAWVTSGNAPDELTAGFADGSGARKVCAYPTKARFLGGDGKDPGQFECR